MPLDGLRRKEDRCRGAGSNELPEWNFEVTVLARAVVVFRTWIVRHRPWRIGGHIARDDQEEAFQVTQRQVRIRSVDRLESCRKRFVLVQVLPPLKERRFVEH